MKQKLVSIVASVLSALTVTTMPFAASAAENPADYTIKDYTTAEGFYNRVTLSKTWQQSEDRVERGEFRKQEMTELVMPDTIRIIGENAFRECIKLKRISLSNNLCEIGAFAFKGCDILETINLHNVDRIGLKAFANCRGLQELDLTSVKYIGAYAFYGCTGLDCVIFSESLASVGSKAFSGISIMNADGSTNPCTVGSLAGKTFIGQNGVLTEKSDGMTFVYD